MTLTETEVQKHLTGHRAARIANMISSYEQYSALSDAEKDVFHNALSKHERIGLSQYIRSQAEGSKNLCQIVFFRRKKPLSWWIGLGGLYYEVHEHCRAENELERIAIGRYSRYSELPPLYFFEAWAEMK